MEIIFTIAPIMFIQIGLCILGFLNESQRRSVNSNAACV